MLDLITNNIWLGVSLGVGHVLLGMDHLAALATISYANSWRAFYLGVRWGLGHSSGLLVVYFVFCWLKGTNSLALFSIAYSFTYIKGELDMSILVRYGDSLVGASMVVMGFYSILGNLKQYNEKKEKKERSFSDKNYDDDYYDHNHDHHSHLDKYIIDMKDPFVQKLLSFSIGLFHGIAGPSHVLGVLPALKLANYELQFVYLFSFIVTSTLSMGLFAAIYGEVTKRMSATTESLDLILGLFSSSLSIIIGTIWFIYSNRIMASAR